MITSYTVEYQRYEEPNHMVKAHFGAGKFHRASTFFFKRIGDRTVFYACLMRSDCTVIHLFRSNHRTPTSAKRIPF